MTKLTIIIAVYNTAPYLRQCIESVVNQSFCDLEIILIDDGSTDGSEIICDEYAAQDMRVKVIHQANAGMTGAINCGLEHASGEWVTFCDSDDWLERDHYEQIFQIIGGTDADIVIENGAIEEMPDGLQRKRLNFDSPFEISAGPDVEQLLAYTQCRLDREFEVYRLLGYYWDKLFRRDWLENNDLRFSTSIAAETNAIDSLFVFQAISKARRIKGVNCTGYHYRVRENSLTTSGSYNSLLPEACLAFYHELEASAEEWSAKESELIRQAMHVRSINSTMQCFERCFFHPDNPKGKKATAAEVRAYLSDSFMKNAIYSNNNQYFGGKRVLFKYLLRLPWVWPAKMYYLLRNIRTTRAA